MKYYNYPKGTKVAVDLDSENTAVVKGPDGKYIVPNELPAVTPEDAGKVVKVNEDGTGIEYVEADEEIFVVTFTDDGVHITMDVSGEDLVSAIKDGKCVYGKLNSNNAYDGRLNSDVYDLIKFTDAYLFDPAIIEFAKINIIPPVTTSPTGKKFTSAYEEKLRVETAFWGTDIKFSKTSIPTAYFAEFFTIQTYTGLDWSGPDLDNISEAVRTDCPVFAWVDDALHHRSMAILSAYTENEGELTYVEFTSLDGKFSFKKEAGQFDYTRIERIPECPITTDGSFVLKATVSNGAVTYSWVAES